MRELNLEGPLWGGASGSNRSFLKPTWWSWVSPNVVPTGRHTGHAQPANSAQQGKGTQELLTHGLGGLWEGGK